MQKNNHFVYCFLWLNEQCYTLVGFLETGLFEASVSTFELDVA